MLVQQLRCSFFVVIASALSGCDQDGGLAGESFLASCTRPTNTDRRCGCRNAK